MCKPTAPNEITKDNHQESRTTTSQQLSFTNLELQEDHNTQKKHRGCKYQKVVEAKNKKRKENDVSKKNMPR